MTYVYFSCLNNLTLSWYRLLMTCSANVIRLLFYLPNGILQLATLFFWYLFFDIIYELPDFLCTFFFHILFVYQKILLTGFYIFYFCFWSLLTLCFWIYFTLYSELSCYLHFYVPVAFQNFADTLLYNV